MTFNKLSHFHLLTAKKSRKKNIKVFHAFLDSVLF
jgi:hypothetical protein